MKENQLFMREWENLVIDFVCVSGNLLGHIQAMKIAAQGFFDHIPAVFYMRMGLESEGTREMSLLRKLCWKGERAQRGKRDGQRRLQ